MRDPFERCWSAARSFVKKARLQGNRTLTETSFLKTSYKRQDYIYRTDYERTIRELETVFDERQIFYGIYEELFEKSNLRSLSDFLLVDFLPDLGHKRVNESPKINNEALGLAGEIREFYSNVYRFCRVRFPRTINLWDVQRE